MAGFRSTSRHARWPDLAANVARVYDALPAADRERACVFAQNYGEAGGRRPRRALGLPRAISGHNSYFSGDRAAAPAAS